MTSRNPAAEPKTRSHVDLIPALISLLILAALAVTAAGAPAVGERAPSLVLSEVDGSRFDLAALHGRVVVVNFWATWCAPCREEMPALDAFHTRFHTLGVELIGISVDRKRDRKAMLTAGAGVHYPIALLSDAEMNGFGSPSAIPMTYIVDPEGIVRAVLKPGAKALTEEALERAVSPFLKGDPGGR